MLTILIWLGSGFAFAVGVIVGVWLFKLFPPMADKERDKQIANDSLTALRDRNAISREQCDYLLRIAECMEKRNK